MPWEPRLWETPIGKFVHHYGAEELADRLDYSRSAVYHWVQGTVVPYPETARKIVALAREARFRFDDGGATRRSLSLDDVFDQPKVVARILEEKSPRRKANAGAGT